MAQLKVTQTKSRIGGTARQRASLRFPAIVFSTIYAPFRRMNLKGAALPPKANS